MSPDMPAFEIPYFLLAPPAAVQPSPEFYVMCSCHSCPSFSVRQEGTSGESGSPFSSGTITAQVCVRVHEASGKPH